MIVVFDEDKPHLISASESAGGGPQQPMDDQAIKDLGTDIEIALQQKAGYEAVQKMKANEVYLSRAGGGATYYLATEVDKENGQVKAVRCTKEGAPLDNGVTITADGAAALVLAKNQPFVKADDEIKRPRMRC